MLIVAGRMGELSFGKLMELYAGENARRGRQCWPQESEFRQLALAEEEAYAQLEAFFAQTGARQYVFCVDGEYRCAARVEPYRDGWLLTALTTAPHRRRQGYAIALLREITRRHRRVYAHIHRKNEASIAVHRKCGFAKLRDSAVLLDGTATMAMATYFCEKQGNGLDREDGRCTI